MDIEQYRVYQFYKPLSDLGETLIKELNLNKEQAQLVKVKIESWSKKNIGSYLDYFPDH